MKIASDMNLRELWERMDCNGANEFDEAAARRMRGMLVSHMDLWRDTADVDDCDWFRMLDKAVQ